MKTELVASEAFNEGDPNVIGLLIWRTEDIWEVHWADGIMSSGDGVSATALKVWRRVMKELLLDEEICGKVGQ